MTEHRLHADPEPAFVTREWYADRARARHIDEAVHQPRLAAARRQILDAVDRHAATSVVDLGAGDGGLLSTLVDVFDGPVYGYDLQPSNIAGARERHVDVRFADVVELVAAGRLIVDGPFGAAVLVCTETLEHLADPHHLVAELSTYPGVVAIVASSPWTETVGDAYEFHLWAWDEAGYRQLFEANGWTVTVQERVGMFTVLTAAPAARQ